MKENNDKNNNQRYILTRETLGMTILLFCVIMLVMLLTRSTVFSSIGTAVCTFMYGTFGYGCFLVLGLLAYLGEWLVWEKKINAPAKCILTVGATVFLLFLLFHSVSARNISLSGYGSFISECYNNAANGLSGYTFGGALSAIFVYPVAKITTFIGAYIIYSVLAVILGYVSFMAVRDALNKGKVSKISNVKTPRQTVNQNAGHTANHTASRETYEAQNHKADNLYSISENYEIVNNMARPVSEHASAQTQSDAQNNDSDKYSRENLGRKILFENDEFAAESYRRNMIFNENSYFNRPVNSEKDYLSSFGNFETKEDKVDDGMSYTESYRQSLENNEGYTPSNYVYGDKPVDALNDISAEQSFNDNSYVAPAPQPESNYSEGEDYEQPEQNTYEQTEQSSYEQISYDEPSAQVDFTPEENTVAPRAEDARRRESEDVIPDRRSYNQLDVDESESLLRGRRTLEETPEENDLDLADLNGGEGRTESFGRRENPVSDGENTQSNSLFNLFSSENANLGGSDRIQPDVSRVQPRGRERSNADLFDDDEEEEGEDIFAAPEELSSSLTDRVSRSDRSAELAPSRAPEPVKVTPPKEEPVPAPEPPKPKHVWKKYVAPTLDLLKNYSESGSANAAEIEENKRAIVETLANVRIESEVINVIVGSKFTRYDVQIKNNTTIKTALKHKDEIQIALRKDTINAYINFKLATLSIEVPNKESGTVGLKSMLASSQFLNSKPNSLTFALGKNIEGDCICPDITKMPHLLVAGTTGSGKSICLSSLIISLLYKYGPEELRFILVDPKQVEFIPYDKLPHLMINEIIFDVDKAIKALNWAIKEMERRYLLFKDMTAAGMATKNLTEYNAHLPEGEEKLPKIVIILDEFGDLMLQAKKEIETRIVRLVQKARACGIHLILATQRPSVDCITGLIKSNLPTRIGFKVNSFDDSRTIFDIGGAEKLLGAGDMYYRRPDRPELQRVQGCFIDSDEVQKVTDYIKEHNETYFDQSVSDFINTVEAPEESGQMPDESSDSDTKIDDTFIKALKYCVTSNQASVSMIQRRFPVGYIKACKIIDWMENMNYITQSEGSKPRKVLLSREEFTNTYGDVDD